MRAPIAIGVSKNWASCHPSKPVRRMPSDRQPELQNSVQTIRAGTYSLNTTETQLAAEALDKCSDEA